MFSQLLSLMKVNILDKMMQIANLCVDMSREKNYHFLRF